MERGRRGGERKGGGEGIVIVLWRKPEKGGGETAGEDCEGRVLGFGES